MTCSYMLVIYFAILHGQAVAWSTYTALPPLCNMHQEHRRREGWGYGAAATPGFRGTPCDFNF